MKFSKKTLIFIALIISNFAFSQVSEKINISKNNILRVFKKTIDQEKKYRIKITSNPWSTETEKYIKSDTIIFVNPSNKINVNYCDLTNWTFYQKTKFVRSFGYYCKEPATEKVTNKNDYFDVKIIEDQQKSYLEIYNQGQRVEKFEIISLEKNQSLSYKNEIKYKLTLLREK